MRAGPAFGSAGIVWTGLGYVLRWAGVGWGGVRLLACEVRAEENAFAQSRFGHRVRCHEGDRALAFGAEARPELGPDRGDERGLAMAEKRITSRLGFKGVDPNGGAAFGLGGEVAGLAPLQRLG